VSIIRASAAAATVAALVVGSSSPALATRAKPAHVIGFGDQVKAKGVSAVSRDASRTIGYIRKYVTKSG
jgi:hypothetical protein